MIEEATVDAYGESEQVSGFYTMIDDNLAVPFETTLLGVPVTITGVDWTPRDEIVPYVVVNGVLVVDEGRITSARPGRILRGPGYKAITR